MIRSPSDSLTDLIRERDTHLAMAMRTTALTAPFIPGASPPLVKMATRRVLPLEGGGGTPAVFSDWDMVASIELCRIKLGKMGRGK
jgi:hypothetical protein